jgi:hypothetical protein
MPHACGNVPVNGADFVAMLVFTIFTKGHTPAFESAVVFPGENAIAQASGFQFDPSYALD